MTHESFVLPKELQQKFEKESGYELVVRASGDAGALTNKLVLTKDNPLGDVSFGVDNTFASRALDEGVFAPYAAKLPEGADQFAARRRRRPGAHADRQRQRLRQRRRHLVRRARASRRRRRSTTW